ncbi:MAG: apolipoprotein N-acyltransferase [Cellvibrionaceae bacterium]|nr:apolipoprotein N-acyltransferase [Cellvibrionaceae bacterium]
MVKYSALLLPGLAVVAGALLPFSLAPYDIWPLGLLSLGLWFYLCLSRPQHLLRYSFAFGLGLFGAGASWVYVSIHDFGFSSMPLAAGLTALFIVTLALAFTLPFALLQKLHKHLAPNISLPWFGLSLAATFVLGEWLRGWLLSGFPWLYLGYGHLDTSLAPWAAVGGALLLSFWVCMSAGAAALLIKQWRGPKRRRNLALLVAALLPWPSGPLLQIDWAKPQGQAIKVGMVQPNIPQALKWDKRFLLPTMERYQSMSEQLWDQDWVVWPEAAIPLPWHRAEEFYRPLAAKAAATNTTLITGSLVKTNGIYHNGALALGLGEGRYFKRRLVPFGEYVPLERQLRGLISFFNMPTSIIKPGPSDHSRIFAHQPGAAGPLGLSPLICYEIAYPNLARAKGAEHPVLLTQSNDAWFGSSIGPLQHMQIARMRALENQRYLIRATNTGVSAIVEPDGQLQVRSEQFKQQVLTGQVHTMVGSTPFARWGQGLVLLLCTLAIGAGLMGGRARTRNP